MDLYLNILVRKFQRNFLFVLAFFRLTTFGHTNLTFATANSLQTSPTHHHLLRLGPLHRPFRIKAHIHNNTFPTDKNIAVLMRFLEILTDVQNGMDLSAPVCLGVAEVD